MHACAYIPSRFPIVYDSMKWARVHANHIKKHSTLTQHHTEQNGTEQNRTDIRKYFILFFFVK